MSQVNYKIKKEVILLTGCINPEGMPFTKLQNPEIRKKQYIDSINFYLEKTGLPILFIENSGTDISEYFPDKIHKGRLEFIAFDGNYFNKRLGKGYGEMLIIERALEESVLLKDADFIYKITGRYKLLNLKSFIKQHQKDNNIKLLVDLKLQLQYSDSRFWGSTRQFLEEILLKYRNKINDSKKFYFEHALCYATHEAISKGYSFSGLKYQPRFKGVYGTDNTKYNHSLIYWLPLNLKQFIKYRSLRFS